MHIIAKGLLEYETLTADDINLLLKGKKPVRPKDDDENSVKNSSENKLVKLNPILSH